MIDSVRALVIVVGNDGTILEARGGFGGFLGLDVARLPGTSVFDFVASSEIDQLATYFIENVDESSDTRALPMPFRISVTGHDGFIHPVDVIPTGEMLAPNDWRWTVLLVPLSLNGSITRSLDLEMEGAPRDAVRRMLCEELRVDNANYTSRWILIDLEHSETPDVIVARDDDAELAQAVKTDLAGSGWAPWAGMAAGETAAVDVAAIPATTRTLMKQQGWQRSIVAPVYVSDRLVAAFLLVGRVPPEYPADSVKANVAARIQTLVQATAMLFDRWDSQDLLEAAASTDSLTGLMNRRELLRNLEDDRRHGAMLYIDVDDFKSVNDNFGHQVGDAVLITVAERILAACRAGDSVGRVGGDEFVVLLHGADQELGRRIGERIVRAVSEPLGLEVGPESVAVSIGLAPLDSDNPLDAADHAMLRAKRSGRGRLELALVD